MKKVSKRGFTLIETVIALSIFVIVLIMALPAFNSFILTNTYAEKKLMAQEIGINQMESIVSYVSEGKTRSQLISDLSDTSSSRFFWRDYSGNSLVRNKDGATVSVFFDDTNPNLVRVTVEIGTSKYELVEYLRYKKWFLKQKKDSL